MVIYKATFPNGKVYIGKTKDFNKRKYQHIWNSKKVYNKHIIMYKAIRKYGEENIKWEILCECDNLEDMNKKEIFYIKEFNSTSFDYGYNMVCDDKEEFTKRENFDNEYQIDIIKRKLKSNGHDPDKYIQIIPEISEGILNDYGKMGIRGLSKKYKISRQRLTRFLKGNNIKIDQNICSVTNSVKICDDFIFVGL